MSGCSVCKETAVFSAPVVAIVMGGGELAEPVNLSPSHELRCCTTGKCDSYFILASRSLQGFLGKPTRWRWARLIFADGFGVGLKIEGSAVEIARA